MFTSIRDHCNTDNLKHIDVGYFKRSEEVMSTMYQYSFDLIRNSKLYKFWSRWYSGDPSGDHRLPPQLSYTESIVFLILLLF